jgi:hypothetical protein
MKKLLQLSLLTYYKNWVMWLTIIGLEILFNVINVQTDLNMYYLRKGPLNPEQMTQAIKNFGVQFECPVTILSYLLIAFMVSTFYTTGIFKRFLFDGLNRYELIFFQLLISILAPILITIVGFLSTQVLLLIYLGIPSLSLITYIQWDMLTLSILGSFIIVQFFLLFVNIFQNLTGLIIPAIVSVADPIAAGYTRVILKVDYYKYYPKEILDAVTSPEELPEHPVLILGLLYAVIILVTNAYLLKSKNQ